MSNKTVMRILKGFLVLGILSWIWVITSFWDLSIQRWEITVDTSNLVAVQETIEQSQYFEVVETLPVSGKIVCRNRYVYFWQKDECQAEATELGLTYVPRAR